MTGDEFRIQRLRAGLTMTEAAAKLGRAYTTIWRWETDRIPIPKAVASLMTRMRPKRSHRSAPEKRNP